MPLVQPSGALADASTLSMGSGWPVLSRLPSPAPPNSYDCPPKFPIGTGHYDATEVGTTDSIRSALVTHDLTLLVVTFRWASDSLAARSSPWQGILHVFKKDGSWRTNLFTTSTKPNAPPVRQTVPSGSYFFLTHIPGSPPLSFDLTFDAGTTIDLVLYIQYGGKCGGWPLSPPLQR